MTQNKLRLLIISESLDIDSGSGAKANLGLIKNFLKAGFKLQVYHYTRKEIYIKGAELISIPENRTSFLFVLSRMERYIRKYFNISLNPKIERKTGFSFTLFNDRNSIITFLKKEKEFNPDWILTLSQGGSFRPHHALLKIPEWHHKWIAYIHDPYPMHWYPKPYTWHESGFKKKEQFMREVAEKSAYTAFPSKMLMEWMGSHCMEFKNKGILIPHQINEAPDIRKPEEIEFKFEEFTILHAGNFLQARKPNGLIKGFKKFIHKNPNAKARLIHVGPAPHYKEYLEKQANHCSQLEVYCENHLYREVAWLQEKTSVNVIMEAKADFSPFLPGKFPHCIAAGKPILLLGPPKSEARRIMGDAYRYWAEIDDVDRISNLIEDLYENWSIDKKDFDYAEIAEYLSPAYLEQTLNQLKKS